jgi:hypothetical protein
LPEHCRRFARVTAQPEDYHRRAPRAAELERIFRLESERIISQDWVVRYDNRFFQLPPQSHNYAPAQSKVLVCEGRHGSISIEYRGEALRWQEIPAPARPSILSAPRERVLAESIKKKWTPPANHPWREAARRGLEKRARRTLPRGGGYAAASVGLALRFALSAPPFGLRRASLRTRPTPTKNNQNSKWGHF